MFLLSRETFFLMMFLICSIPVLALIVYAFWHRFWMHFGIHSGTIFELLGLRIWDVLGVRYFHSFYEFYIKNGSQNATKSVTGCQAAAAPVPVTLYSSNFIVFLIGFSLFLTSPLDPAPPKQHTCFSVHPTAHRNIE